MITKKAFGKTNKGDAVTLYTIDNGLVRASVMDFGATLVSLETKDRNGDFVDIVLGYDDASGYDNDRGTYFGATVGRFANRIRNGIFKLNGEEYHLPLNNNGIHCLHGGIDCFSFIMYDGELGDDSISASIFSPDGEEGFPGNMRFTVKYTLKETSLFIEFFAKSDKDTIASFTNHSYFNLNGGASGTTMLNQVLTLNSDAVCEVDSDAFPTGVIMPVDNTVFDFRKGAVLGDRLGKQDKLLTKTADGIDNNFVLSMFDRDFKSAGKLYNPDNGIEVECLTDMPAVQIYTGGMTDTVGKKGAPCKKFCGICLETQEFPDAINCSYVPSPILKAGKDYYSKTVFKMGVK